MGTFSRDFRYAARMLGKNPGFTLVAVLTLALGIGANTAIFSLMNAVILRPLPVKDPEQLVLISEDMLKGRGRRSPTMAAYLTWKRSSHTLEDIALAAFGGDPTTLSGTGLAERVSEAYCGPNFLSMLGVKAFRGRLFLPEDAPSGEGTTVLISAELWQRTLNADPTVLGRTVTLADSKKTIVGVLPPGFSVLPWDMHVDVWLAYNETSMSTLRWLSKLGRLKPVVTIQQAQAELNAIAQGMPQHLDADRDWGVRLEYLHEAFGGGARRYFYLLLGAVGFILLIACANVANLLLASAAMRQREFAIRASLGAARSRLLRQLLAESILLAVLGGSAGLLLGLWGIRVLTAIGPIDEMRALHIGLHPAVLVFTLGLSLGTGIVFGILPALRASKPDLNESLKESGRADGGTLRLRGQGLLLVSEIGLAVVLLVGAGLMITSFVRLQKVDLGFNPKNVLRADVFLDGPHFFHNVAGQEGYMKEITPRSDAFFSDLLERLPHLPGVVSAGISHLAPPGDIEGRTFRIVGHAASNPGNEPEAGYNEVSAGYFRSLDIPLLQGRYISEKDTENSPWVVDINETMATRLFPKEDPIGKLLQTKLRGSSNVALEEDRPREIVGVVGDVRHFGYYSERMPIMYGSYRQHGIKYPTGLYTYHTWKSITIRTTGDPMRLIAPLQRVVADVDKNQALFDVQTMEQGLSASVGFNRFQANLFSIFGGLGLVLAAVGIYGVMSYLVAQRTHEIGVRVALGARTLDVLRMVIMRGLTTAAIGVVAGVGGSLALTRLIAGFLFGVKNTDPVTYITVAAILLAVSLAACYIPARRATRVDPLVALRHE